MRQLQIIIRNLFLRSRRLLDLALNIFRLSALLLVISLSSEHEKQPVEMTRQYHLLQDPSLHIFSWLTAVSSVQITDEKFKFLCMGY